MNSKISSGGGLKRCTLSLPNTVFVFPACAQLMLFMTAGVHLKNTHSHTSVKGLVGILLKCTPEGAYINYSFLEKHWGVLGQYVWKSPINKSHCIKHKTFIYVIHSLPLHFILPKPLEFCSGIRSMLATDGT